MPNKTLEIAINGTSGTNYDPIYITNATTLNDMVVQMWGNDNVTFNWYDIVLPGHDMRELRPGSTAPEVGLVNGQALWVDDITIDQ